MKKKEAKRQAIIATLTDHLLTHGMGHTGLRRLAQAAGTSDRMLLHYFANKDELMSATLSAIAEKLETILSAAQHEPMPLQQLLPHLASLIDNPVIQPFTRLWLEITALAVRDETLYRPIARAIMASFYQWICSNIAVNHEEQREPLACLALATVEGCVLLNAVDTVPKIQGALTGLALLGNHEC